MPKRLRIEEESTDEEERSEESTIEESYEYETFKSNNTQVETIEDLIKIANEWNKFSENIQKTKRRRIIRNTNERHSDYVKLSSILDELYDIKNMVGLKELKKSIVDQILFFIQDLNSNEMMHTALIGDPGVGKCCAYNTPVIMCDGTLKMVQDVKQGEQLMGDDGNPRNVLNVVQGFEKMYKVKQQRGDDYIVNKYHILTLTCDMNMIINNKEYNKGDIIDIPIQEFISFTPETQKHLLGFKAELHFKEKECPINPYKIGEWLSFENNNFWMFGKIPKIYKINSREIRMELLAGIIDASGHLDNIRNTYNIYHENLDVVNDLVFISRSLGFFTTVKDFRITISGDIHNIPSKIFIPLAEEKKQLTTKIEVVELSEDNYYGFYLDGNHRYLLGDMTVTHNTTIGRVLGNIYKKLGILSKGTFTIVRRNDFVGKYLGHTSDKTQRLLNRCKGGVMFIDEAYSLGPVRDDGDSFSKEAIDTLNQFLSENNDDFICIIAGYEKQLQECFFSKNPGLERRFPWKFKLDSYSGDELYDIFIYQIITDGWSFNWNSKDLKKHFSENSKLFTENGGDCKILLDKCKISHARRIFGLENKNCYDLTHDDFLKGFTNFKISKRKKEKEKPPQGMYC